MDDFLVLFIINVALVALCGFIYIILPGITRKAFLFGVKIPGEQAEHPEVLDIRKRYIRAVFLATLLIAAICIIQYLVWPGATLIFTLYFPVLLVPMFFLAFVPAWRAAGELKEREGWAVSSMAFADTKTAAARGSLGMVPWIWYILGLMVVIASIIVTIIRFPYLGDYIITHWDLAGNPTSYREATWWAVMMLPLVNLGMLLTMVLAAISIVKAKLQIDPANPQLSFAQHQVYRRRMGGAIGFLTLVMIAFIALTGLAIVFPYWEMFPVLVGGTIAIHLPIIALIVVQIRTGQGGCKVKIDPAELEDIPENIETRKTTYGRGDDKYWKFGSFYCNPDDPAHLVEDRFGSSISFNFSRPIIKFITALFIIGLVVMYAWLTISLI